MRLSILTTWTLGLMSLFITQTSIAYEPESALRLEELAKVFIAANTHLTSGDRLEVKLSQAANELQLQKCSTTIEVSLPPNASINQPNTLLMHCTGPEAWQVYVPVSSHVYTKVLVAKQPIPPHQIIDASLLDLAEMDRNQLFSGYFSDMNAVIGQVAAASIPTGTVLTSRNIQQPIIIHRNQVVSIIAEHGPIIVKASGVAKADGAIKDTIPVYNPSSKRTIEGLIKDASTVEAI